MSSMINHFKDMLMNGETPEDPFETATQDTVKKQLSEEKKAAMRAAWNKRIADYYADKKAAETKMHYRRARRMIRHR